MRVIFDGCINCVFDDRNEFDGFSLKLLVAPLSILIVLLLYFLLLSLKIIKELIYVDFGYNNSSTDDCLYE
jgi:hypothetical protein